MNDLTSEISVMPSKAALELKQLQEGNAKLSQSNENRNPLSSASPGIAAISYRDTTIDNASPSNSSYSPSCGTMNSIIDIDNDDTGSEYMKNPSLSVDSNVYPLRISENNRQKEKPLYDNARKILLKITCQAPEKDTKQQPASVTPKVTTRRPSFRRVHLELKDKFITDLQSKVETREAIMKRALVANKNLKDAVNNMKESLMKANNEIEGLPRTIFQLDLMTSFNKKLHEDVTYLENQLIDAQEQNSVTRREIYEAKLEVKQLEHDNASLRKELRRRGNNDKEIRATNCLIRATQAQMEKMKAAHKNEMKKAEDEYREREQNLQVQLRAVKLRHGMPLQEEPDIQDRHHLKAAIHIRDESITVLRNQVLASESTRRKLHNVIQELRGNIRVFVRVRPFLEGEGTSKDRNHPVTPINVVEAGNALTLFGKHEDATFQFDKVYGPSSTQDNIFEELSDFVQSALDGYSACIFAYGQTGSGKTHTMQGEGFGDMRGITPRAVEQILRAGNLMQHTWNFYVQANFVEIYNEKLVDLLVDIEEEIEFSNSCDDEMMTLNPGINRGSSKLTLRKDVLGQTYVEGLTNVMIDISDIDKGMAMINSILKCASRARSVAATKMNDRSSRSHSVFTLDIAGKNMESGAVTAGSLHLVDLAGSERLKSLEDAVDPQQLKETVNINKSLSCLGDVFSSLASDATHVPYRNSKLTYLLQNCLGGEGKSCMVVNLSPTMESSNESMCSLRFAQRVSQIELGSGSKKVQLSQG